MSIFAYLAIAFVIFIAGAAGGVKWQVGVQASRELERIAAQEREILRRTDKIDKSAERREVRKAEVETVFRDIERKVDHVVTKIEYRNQCFDDDGMRELGSAIAAIRDAASKPKAAVSAPRWPW